VSQPRATPLPEAPLRELDPTAAGPTDYALARDPAFADLLARSYHDRVGRSLLLADVEPALAAAWLFEQAPFCLLAHNTAADPRFIYGNRTAQACFGYDWDELTQLPSRLSALPDDRSQRQRFIDAVTRDGFATGYRGLRVARSGRRFWIEDVTLWQVTDAAGVLRAQAAVYPRWRDA
jgi:PAS domain S-box-containing protein